jgi:NAD-dependent deacetylase
MDYTDVRNIVVLTGAGVSAESGLATFAGPTGCGKPSRRGRRDSGPFDAIPLVHAFYDARRGQAHTVQPNSRTRRWRGWTTTGRASCCW